MKNLTDTVRAVVAEELDLPLDSFLLTDSFYALGADSLESAALFLALEDALRIEISVDEAAKLTTPQQVIDYAWNSFTTQT